MKQQKLIDLTGAPFIVELHDDGKWYVIGVKVRKRQFLFESTGLPVEIVDKISGNAGDGKINGIEELEEFLDGTDENTKLQDLVPEGFATDEDMTNAWQEALDNAKRKAGIE